MGQYLDIIIFAVIAVALLLRLRSVLGTRNDGEQEGPPFGQVQDRTAPHPKQIEGMAQLQALTNGASIGAQDRWAQNPPNFDVVETATAHNRLSQFLAVDPAFRPADFLDKARKAFALILSAYAQGNKNTLEILLAPELQASFNALIDAREARRETYHSELHGIKKAVITDADLDGTTAKVSVDFTAEQSVTHKDADGRFIGEGDGGRRVTHDRWVFTRDLKDPGPTWKLQQIVPEE